MQKRRAMKMSKSFFFAVFKYNDDNNNNLCNIFNSLKKTILRDLFFSCRIEDKKKY